MNRTIARALVFSAVAAGCSGSDGADGERGEQGEGGERGPAGPKGDPGEDGRDAAVDPSLSGLEKAAVALGGAEAIRELETLRYTATGTRFAAGERLDPDGAARDVGTFQVVASVDVVRDALRLDVSREVLYPFAAPLEYSDIVRGNLGYVTGTDNVVGAPEGPMNSAKWASIRKEFTLMNPLLLVRHALDVPDAVKDAGMVLFDGVLHHVVQITLPSDYGGFTPASLFVHAGTGMITKSSLRENDALLRDVGVEAFYANWEPAGPVRVPLAISVTVGEHVVRSEQRSEVEAGAALPDDVFDFPAGARPEFDEESAHRAALSHQWHEEFHGIGIPLDGLDTTVTSSELAPGVFHLTGAIHHSLVIEQDEGVVVVEAPLYPERADAIIEYVHGAFGGKPISHVVATHHHVDHSAGLRSFVAEGARVVASARSLDVYREAFAATSRVSPDRLSREPRAPSFLPVPVAGAVRLGDAARPIDVIHVSSSHASDCVIVSLPSQGVVFQSDLYSPGFPIIEPIAAELRDQILSLGLDASLMPAGHGAVSSFDELREALGE